MSENCPKCGQIVFGGHGCIKCGHVSSAKPAPPAPNQAAGPAPAGPAPAGDEDEGNKKLMIAGAVVAALVVIGGLLAVLSGGGDTPEEAEELAYTPTTEPEPVTLDRSFCQDPSAISDAPEPSATETNGMKIYHAQGLKWALAEDYDTSIVQGTASDAAYAACVDSIGNGKDQTCSGYEGNTRYTIAGMTHTVAVYELASGEKVLEKEVDSARDSCPPVIFDTRGTQKVNEYQVLMAVAPLAQPAEFTHAHLAIELDYLSPEWCAAPSAIPQAGQNAETPGLMVLGASAKDLEIADSYKPDTITHVACMNFVRSGVDPAVCEYPRAGSYKVRKGTYEVTVVELATGNQLATEEFEGYVGCPMTVITSPGWTRTRDSKPPATAYEMVASVMETAL